MDHDQTARTFGATIRLRTALLEKIEIKLECTAPVEAFALLEKEGSTYIHTTVMANCDALVKRGAGKELSYASRGVNLLEAKE